MAAETPPDLEVVRYAFRLGWALAELRGRYSPRHFGERDPGHGPALKRDGFGLPLASERSPAELRIELTDTVEDLSTAVGLTDAEHVTRWTAVRVCLENVENAKDPQERATQWNGAAERFYKLDAHNQDTLVLHASCAAAYQLGRGLAETYWALDPDAQAGSMGSWEAVLGAERQKALSRLAARLSPYVGQEALAAVVGPLQSWTTLASDTKARSDEDVTSDLYRQGLLWRDLVRGEQAPSDLALTKPGSAPPPAGIWSDLKLYQNALVTLRVPLVIGVISVGALVAGAALLAAGASTPAVGTVVGILGAVGLTSSGLYARAKAEVTSLVSSLEQTVRIARVQRGANLCPAQSTKLPAGGATPLLPPSGGAS